MQLGYIINRNYYPIPQNKSDINWILKTHWSKFTCTCMCLAQSYNFHFQHQCDGLWASYMHEHNNNLTGSKDLYHKKILVEHYPSKRSPTIKKSMSSHSFPIWRFQGTGKQAYTSNNRHFYSH
jgi:hypothetical protein